MDINLELAFVGRADSTDEGFEAFIETILEELENIERDDIEVTASLTQRTATFTAFGGDGEASADRLLNDVRTALHAANCATPGWEAARLRLAAETVIVGGRLVDA